VSISMSRLELSVIIVNYNVKHFLEQCLYSVRQALKKTSGEIIVIDNCSSDNSLAYLQPDFPDVRFVANKENLGFARACNQGWKMSSGRFVLFLNPDTILPEDCFEACIRFFDQHPEAGALGSKMLDGSGAFLKESKRAFPSPLTSLYKLFGLSKLFPRSAHFSRYHLGHLDENKNNEVDVLAGAYMMIKKEVLDQVGGFDERFFMYGEDVDLSYRIQKSGQKNFYFAGSPIIHFKGESTRKGSMNYVRMFYSAMSLFVRKHYGGRQAGFFNSLIHLAIWFRAALSASGQFIRRIGLPLIDAVLILFSFWFIKEGWSQYVRPEIQYENRLLWMAIPGFTLLYLVTAYYAGLYDKWYRWGELIRSTAVATIILLAAYSLLPEQFRFSRAIVLFGAVLAFILISTLRYLLIKAGTISSEKNKEAHTTFVVAGSVSEYKEVIQLLEEAGFRQQVLGRVAVETSDTTAIGHISQLPALAASLPFREVIFCQGALSFSAIIEAIRGLPRGVTARIHATHSHSVVGSDSKDSSGEAVSKENGYQLADPYYRRLKRGVDVLAAIIGLAGFPLLLFLIRKPGGFLMNIFKVLLARNTWIGYTGLAEGLPVIRKGILGCNGLPPHQSVQLSAESLYRADYWYAHDYTPSSDIKLIFRFYRNLGG
jgi:O-antigen biosynthesis protein